MSGYLKFKPTGVDFIDNIASEIEYAADSYHHTEFWADKVLFDDNAKTHVELIQEALNEAANAYLLRCIP